MLKSLAIGFVLAIAITVFSVLLFTVLDPRVSIAWAFAPGFAIMRVAEATGAQLTNRFAVNSTFLFWWIVSTFAVLVFERRRVD